MDAWLSNLQMFLGPLAIGCAFGAISLIFYLIKLSPKFVSFFSDINLPIGGRITNFLLLAIHLIVLEGAILGLVIVAENLIEILLFSGNFSNKAIIGIIIYAVSTILSVFTSLFATQVLETNGIIRDVKPYRIAFFVFLIIPAGVFNVFSIFVYLPLTIKYLGKTFNDSFEKKLTEEEKRIEQELKNPDKVFISHRGIKVEINENIEE